MIFCMAWALGLWVGSIHLKLLGQAEQGSCRHLNIIA